MNMINYISKGYKNNQLLGIEIEHFVLDNNNNSVYYSSDNGKPGISDILKDLSNLYDKRIYEKFNNKRYLIGLKRKDCEISIEPGAQFEVSICPQSNTSQINKIYKKWFDEVQTVLSKYNYHLANIGYRPDACALEVPLIPKMRYYCMDANFKNVGKYGTCMMRCSCATQINIDYKNEKDCIKKLQIATALSPIFYFLFDNTNIFERTNINSSKKTPSGYATPKRMVRWEIWNNTDADRCGSIPEIFNKNLSLEKYVENVKHFDEIYVHKNIKTDKNIIKNKLSFYFYDVRLKDTIEIRCADSMPQEFLISYVELIKNLFYNSYSLNKLEEIFKNVTNTDFIKAGKQLQNYGWKATVYNYKIDKLMRIILNISKIKSSNYIKPIEKLVNNKICLKDYLNETYKPTSNNFNPICLTKKYTKIQADNIDKYSKDIINLHNTRKKSKVSYMNVISKTGYFSKVYDLNNQIQFQFIVNKTHKIIEKICNEYWDNPDYRKLFFWDKFSERIINFKPKYRINVPICRYDIFYNENTGNFEFCEINTGGSAAMSKVTYACEEIKKTIAYKKLKKHMQNTNKGMIQAELYKPWINDFKQIYKQWCKNNQLKYKKYFNIAMVDLLDNCQLPDFIPFKKVFENNGIKCHIYDIRNLKFNGKNLLTKNNKKIDAIYKRVTLDDLINYKNNTGVKAMIDAVLSNKVCPIDWFSTQIVHDKQIFYIIHKPQTLKLMTPSEKSFIKKHFPETHILNRKILTTKKFIKYKNQYLIKPRSSRDSKNVYVGKELNQTQWKQILNKCSKNNNYIIQKFCKIYTSPNIKINPNANITKQSTSIKQYCQMEGLYCYNSKFRGIYLRQGEHTEDSTNFDMTVPVFYETEK